MVPVGEVGHVCDAGQALGLHSILDLLDHALRADLIRQLGHHESGATRSEGFDRHLAAHLERAATLRIRVLDSVQTHHDAPGGEVRAGHEVHQLVDRGVGMLEQMNRCRDDLDEVVRRHIRRHAHRDARRTVDQQIRVRRRQHGGLAELPVVVRDEVDDVLVEVLRQRECRRREARFGVAGSSRTVVEGAEVAVAVHERYAQREGLRQTHEGVVDGGVPVGVELSHHLADDPCALDVASIGAQAHVCHLIQDAALHGLQSVAGIGQCARVDDRVGVLEERPLHLGRDVDVFDALLVGGGVGGRCGHGDLASGDGGLRGAPDGVRDWPRCLSAYPRSHPEPGASPVSCRRCSQRWRASRNGSRRPRARSCSSSTDWVR